MQKIREITERRQEKTREKVLKQGGAQERRWCRGTVGQETVLCCAPREAEAFLGQDQATVSLHPVPIPMPLLEDPVPISMKRRHKVEGMSREEKKQTEAFDTRSTTVHMSYNAIRHGSERLCTTHMRTYML